MVVATKESDTVELMRRGRLDYSWFMTHALDVQPEHLWEGMRKVNNSVRDHERTTVPAGHGVSKTYGAARIGLSFLLCYYPSTVVTTAPSLEQVKRLWKEIRVAHRNPRVPLGGKLTTLGLDMQPETGVKWYATGLSTRPDTVTGEATRIQGIHNEYVLIILEEAAAVLPEIWRAVEHIGAPFKRVLAIGNPTSRFGDFADTLDDPSYNAIRISVTDTPNFKTGKKIIPGVYGREYEQRIRLKYGKDSDEYNVRVLGLKSQKGAEGAYYGKVMQWLGEHGRITDVPFNGALPVYTVWDPGYVTALWFFQPRGLDIAFIRCHEDAGLGMQHWAEILKTYEKQEGYRYGGHFAPIDTERGNQYRVVAGKSLLESARDNGIDLKILEPEFRVIDGIDRTSQFLYRCWFDRTNCKLGLKALNEYCARKNLRMSTEDQPVFINEPERNWTVHLADAMRYASIAVNRCGSNQSARQRWRQLKEQHG